MPRKRPSFSPPEWRFATYKNAAELEVPVLRVSGPLGTKDEGKQVWCARIAGRDAEWGYDREWMGDRREVERIEQDGSERWTEMLVLVELHVEGICKERVGECAHLKDGDLIQISSARFKRGWFRYRDEAALPAVSPVAQAWWVDRTTGWLWGYGRKRSLDVLSKLLFDRYLDLKSGRPSQAAQGAQTVPERIFRIDEEESAESWKDS
jgi:hypothetical protein